MGGIERDQKRLSGCPSILMLLPAGARFSSCKRYFQERIVSRRFEVARVIARMPEERTGPFADPACGLPKSLSRLSEQTLRDF